ncbi:MAG TPA: PilZ domain-containing protein [Terriglobales bacterium]|nr:PilZ domain-containing protein [Terriglobales bacterium]
MGSLSQLQVPAQLEVRVWGMDASGKPFFQTAHTITISSQAATLTGVTCLEGPGEVIGVQHGDQKARFRVVWMGRGGTADEGQLGIESLDADKCIWAEALEQASSGDGSDPEPEVPGPDPAPQSTQAASTRERRRYPRYRCSGTVQLSKEGGGPSVWMNLADIGLGGCYLETLSPVPLNTNVQLLIHIDEMNIRGRGNVRTVHPAVGNGIAFTQMSAEDWKRLHQLVARLGATGSRQTEAPASRPAGPPAAAPPPVRAAVQDDTRQSLEALLQILERKGLITRDEFLAELMSIKLRRAQ